ncbi:MAG: hypothetical protein AAF590_09575 [Pseudomonadota bacterium]
MNRIDPSLTSDTTHILLSPDLLKRWSASDFALARRIAKGPVSIPSGLPPHRLELAPEPELRSAEPAVVWVPLTFEGVELCLAVSQHALDQLVHSLDPDVPIDGVGNTVSLDAIECLIAALFEPVGDVQMGYAHWVGEDNLGGKPAPAPLWQIVTGSTSLGLDANIADIARFFDSLSRERFVDTLAHAPLTVAPTISRLAVTAETMLARVELAADEVERLEPGDGIRLDTVWPDGHALIGRRFVSLTDEHWTVEPAVSPTTYFVRSASTDWFFDSPHPDKAAVTDKDFLLELVDMDGVVATGQLTNLESVASRPVTVFRIDRLAR